MVHDSTYFSTEIRHKINMISQELGALKNEGDMITRENSNLASFEKRADLLSEDLRELQGKLGDLNTLVDRLNADADLEDIDRSYNQLQKKNQSENNILDDAFSSRQVRVSYFDAYFKTRLRKRKCKTSKSRWNWKHENQKK